MTENQVARRRRPGSRDGGEMRINERNTLTGAVKRVERGAANTTAGISPKAKNKHHQNRVSP